MMLKIFARYILLIVLTCSPCVVFASDSDMQVPGNFVEVSVDDPAVKKAAAFAIQQIQQGNLVEIKAAQKDAKTNSYMLKLKLATADGAEHTYAVMVTSNSGSMQVIKFNPLD